MYAKSFEIIPSNLLTFIIYLLLLEEFDLNEILIISFNGMCEFYYFLTDICLPKYTFNELKIFFNKILLRPQKQEEGNIK